ncbi:heme exporter protein CcmD [Marinomonas sp. C2222]|uniref:Heme exporter protein D n=1 Tax=Marinomonas sargassi TaxID=2984494 RepID=A0ABT2YNA3_9GAMM|nr:heme exporter protein CcmD [Marinomonas sargassi]MCV2401362.1 heme exporter protein CcmD [Marinomonas sargassi]
MAFETFSEFLVMGKHGVYVWTAYGISFTLISSLAIHTLKQNTQIRAKLRRRMNTPSRDK